MNLIHIDENGLHLVFERKEDGTCKLLHFSALPFDEDRLLRQHDRSTGEIKVNTERYNLLEIMVSGQDRPLERHGNKYISTAPGYRMQLVDFADKLEKASLQTIEDGVMTGDLASMSTLENITKVNTEEFLLAIRDRLEKLL